MSTTRHNGRMNLTKLRTVWLSLLGLAVVVAWAIVLTIAVHVSEILLDTLGAIVELAALTP